MNLDELRTFLEIIDSGSLVAASRRLHVTPSTVTARVSALEEEIGQKLLHRNKSGAELTSAGFKLKRYAELMTQLWRQARYEVSLPPGVEGVCNVGLEFDLWRGVGERLLTHVRSHLSGVALSLWPGEQPQLHRWLGMGLIDVAICFVAEAGEGVANHVLFEDEIVMVSARPNARPDLDESYLFVDHGEEFRRQHAAAFPGDRTSLVTIAASDWALDYLRQIGGKGYLPRRYADGLLARGDLYPVAGAPSFKRPIYVVERVTTVGQWGWYRRAIASLQRIPV